MLKGQQMPIADMVDYAQRAETAGYHSVWVPEFWRECFVPAAAIAMATSRIKIGSGISVAYLRSPALLGMTVANIDEVSQGRFIFGLGTGAFEPNEYWHDVRDQSRPLTRLREVAEIVSRVLAAEPGQQVNYEGRDVSTRYLPMFFKPLRSRVPLYLGSIKPRSLELAARTADGAVLGAMMSMKYLEEVVDPHLRKGARDAGRRPEDIDLGALVTTAIADDPAVAREMVRDDVATYLPFEGIADVFRVSGFADQQKAAAEAFLRNDLDAVRAAVTDEMVDALTLSGTPDQVRAKLEELRQYLKLPILLGAAAALTPEEITRNTDRILETFTADGSAAENSRPET
jgi:alkanesulfonate monooxygenase SsuD/methylene tetrahydromethanopterin reductase-like flavin-dependent oxidoreductase (luciferase family)